MVVGVIFLFSWQHPSFHFSAVQDTHSVNDGKSVLALSTMFSSDLATFSASCMCVMVYLEAETPLGSVWR